jgi:hypothetical protein
MFKMKLMVGLAALMTSMVVMAVPAMAEFVSNTEQGQGKIKTFPETTTFESTTGGPAVTCKNASGEPKGEWHIQAKEYKKQGKYFYQEVVKKGPHLELKIEKWGHCVGPTEIAVTVKCNLQVEEQGTGSVQAPACEALVGPESGNHCLIIVPQGGNMELPGVSLENLPPNEIGIKSNVTTTSSFTEETGNECKILGIKGSQAGGSFKTKNALIAEGLKIE